MKLSDKVTNDIKAISNNRCFYCGKSFDYVKFEYDHFEPLSLNRNGQRSNIVASCKDCNRKKSDLTIENFRQKLEKIHGEKIIFFFEKYGINLTSPVRYENALNDVMY